MKKLFCFTVLLISFSATSQTVFSVSSKYDADVKIFVASSKYDADLIVYKCSSKYDATDNKGLWFFVDSKYDASWRNTAKKSFLY